MPSVGGGTGVAMDKTTAEVEEVRRKFAIAIVSAACWCSGMLLLAEEEVMLL